MCADSKTAHNPKQEEHTAEDFVLKSDVYYSQDAQTLKVAEQGYAVCTDDRSAGVYRELPEICAALPLTDHGDRLIVPGLADLHFCAPQCSFRGLGMDFKLLEWLNARTFPEEAKCRDNEYAKKACSIFADNMKHSTTTRARVFTTPRRDAMEIFMGLVEEAGLKTVVGKVNMNRNSPDFLVEKGPEVSTGGTIRWLGNIEGRYKNTMPILTPRFIPTYLNEPMERLKEIQTRYDLPVQSHLSENRGGISWVQELCPWPEFYGDTYGHFGLFGNGVRTTMAHCVWLSHEEVSRVRDSGVLTAHYPQPNTNLSSGIMPVRTCLDQGIRVGLDTNVVGGMGESIFRTMADATRVSKLRWRLVDESLKPLTVEEAFYLGTVGGGAFFGRVESFEEGYELDAVVLNDQSLKHPQPLGVKERLERFIYLSDRRHIDAKYASGSDVF